MKHYCFLTGLYRRYDVLMFERQGKSLVKAGFKVTYIVCDNGPNENVDGIDIVSTHFSPKNRLDRFMNTKRILQEYAFRVDADCYQISDPELIDMASYFHKQGKKVVFNMREFYPTMIKRKSYLPKFMRGIMGRWYEYKLRSELPNYDAVFTVTDWILDVIKNKYKIANSYLLTNFPRVTQNYTLTFKDYCKRGDVLFYEGTIYAQSRQENVLKSMEYFPQLRYLLAGKMESSVEVIKDMPAWDRVDFIDGFTTKDLPSLFSRATICNVFRDFFGEDGSLGVIKVFESMEAALPVLFADVPLYRKINEKYKCGICVNPNSVESIKEALDYLIKNKREAYEMGQRGRKAVITEFCWEQQAENYINIINNII